MSYFINFLAIKMIAQKFASIAAKKTAIDFLSFHTDEDVYFNVYRKVADITLVFTYK